jgi:hypothetical protein
MNPIVSLKYYDENFINNYQGMVAWLLYSDVDANFAKYVKESWNALDRISGNHCLITLIEKPQNYANVEYWKNLNLSEENSKKVYEYLLKERPSEWEAKVNDWFLNFKPYDRNVHIEIANKLDVPYTEMPCLVFYTNTKSKEYLVYSFSNEWSFDHISEHMKAIFTAVRKYADEKWDYNATEEMKRKNILPELESDFKKIRAAKFVKRITNNTSIGNVIKSIGLIA